MTTLNVQGQSILNDVSATNLELTRLNVNGQSNLSDVSANNMELETLNSLNTTIGTLSVSGLATFSGISTDNFSVANGITSISGLATFSGGISADNFSVADTNGNTIIGGTLGVSGLATFSGISADNFSVADGITTITGELRPNGGIKCDIDKFVVADTTGNTTIAGTLGVSGLATFSGISADNFSVADGITTITGELRANGGIKCDIDKFVVADTTGNTTIAGTLNVSGLVTFNSNIISTRFKTIKPVDNRTSRLPTPTSPLSIIVATNVVLGGGTQVIFIETGGYRTTIGLGIYRIELINSDGNVVANFSCPHYFNATGGAGRQHYSFTFSSTLAAGTYSINFIRNTTGLIHDANSFLDISIMEMPY
jgi:hypothetical protein